jgi:hypothetical protein
MARKQKPKEEPIKRFILTLPANLHQRIKLSATSRQITMVEAIVTVLEKAPWPVKDAA